MGYDLIIMAGQSNAVGFGWGDTQFPFIENPRITHLIDTYPIKFVKDENGKSRLDMPFPPQLLFESAKEIYAYDKFNGNIANSFATEYIKSGRLKEGRKIMIVKTAVGGTGFAKKYWCEGGVCYEKMFYMIDEALKIAGDDSKIVAFLWHQGEHDAFEMPEWDSETRAGYYRKHLSALLKAVREKYKPHNFPIIAGEFVREWMETHSEQCAAVLSATEDVFRDIGNAKLTSSAGLLSNGKQNDTDDILHFSKESLAIFGKRYYASFEELVGKI